MDFKDRQREAMRLAAGIERQRKRTRKRRAPAERSGSRSFFFYRCHTSLTFFNYRLKIRNH